MNQIEAGSGCLSYWEAILITLNLAIAITIYSVPWGIVQIGWVIGLSASFFILSTMIITGIILIQILTRMNKLHEYSLQGYSIAPVPFFELFKNYPAERYISIEKIRQNKSLKEASNYDNLDITEMKLEESTPLLKSYKNLPKIEQKSLAELEFGYDLTLMCKTLIGKVMERVMNAIIVCGNLMLLIASASIFASSLTSTIPIGTMETCEMKSDPSFTDNCHYKYLFYIGILVIISISLCFYFHFYEQTAYLIAVAIGRIVLIIVIVITAMICKTKGKELDDNSSLE
jgi:hypothetical protein